jgi:protein arginine kinase activator
MKCSFCKKNESIILIHEYSDYGIRKLNLCLECALKKGLATNIENIDGLFVNLVKNLFNAEYVFEDQTGQKKRKFSITCPSCRSNITEISENLKVGCTSCYKVYEKIIDLIIFKRNNSLDYKGKLPKALMEIKNIKLSLKKLKIELKKHVVSEEYAKAALVRDEIKKMKQKIRKEVGRFAKQ